VPPQPNFPPENVNKKETELSIYKKGLKRKVKKENYWQMIKKITHLILFPRTFSQK